MSMQRSIFPSIIVAVSVSTAAWAQPLSLRPPPKTEARRSRSWWRRKGRRRAPNSAAALSNFCSAVAPRSRAIAAPEPDGNAAYATTAPNADPRLEQQSPASRWIRAICARRSSIAAAKRPAPSSSIRRTSSSIWSRAAAGRCATASASAARASPGRACTHLGQEGMAGLGAAAGNARAPARFAALHGRRPGQSARRARDVSRLDASTASTARTSPGPSATTCRPAASACAMPT